MPQVQMYKLELIRETTGKWTVCGYWRVSDRNRYKWETDTELWSLDGAPRTFDTRADALTFCANVTGIPD